MYHALELVIGGMARADVVREIRGSCSRLEKDRGNTEMPCLLSDRRLRDSLEPLKYMRRPLQLTDIQHQALRRRIARYLVSGLPMDNGTDKVNVKDGVEVNEMEDDSNAQKTQAPQPGHDRCKRVTMIDRTCVQESEWYSLTIRRWMEMARLDFLIIELWGKVGRPPHVRDVIRD